MCIFCVSHEYALLCVLLYVILGLVWGSVHMYVSFSEQYSLDGYTVL
jgi:hypothetical protein